MTASCVQVNRCLNRSTILDSVAVPWHCCPDYSSAVAARNLRSEISRPPDQTRFFDLLESIWLCFTWLCVCERAYLRKVVSLFVVANSFMNNAIFEWLFRCVQDDEAIVLQSCSRTAIHGYFCGIWMTPILSRWSTVSFHVYYMVSVTHNSNIFGRTHEKLCIKMADQD